MGKKLVPRTAKVLSETKKTKDKQAVAIAYEHIPRNPAEQKHGSIYAVIELEDKSGRAEEIAERIIDILYENYYGDTDREPLAAFEAALAKINDELTERSSEGQIDWLGKLNAVLAVLSGSTLHTTQSGKAEAYLYRGEHAMHITDGLAGDNINPQRTFINIASGDLTIKDRLAIVTPGVFFKVSKSELKKYATENSPKMAAENLSKLLQGENGTTKPNAILLMEVLSPESLLSDEESEEQTEVWVPANENTGEKLGAGVADGTVKAFDYLGKAYTGVSTLVTTKIIPKIKKTLSGSKASLKGFQKETTAESIILSSEEKITPEHLGDLDINNAEGVLETNTPKTPDREIRIKETHKKPRMLSLEHFNFSFMDRAKTGWSERKFRFRLPSKKQSYIYLGIAGALILGLALFLYFGSQSGQTIGNGNLGEKYAQAQSLYEQAEGKIESGDLEMAATDLKNAEALVNELMAANYQMTESEALLSKIKSGWDRANKITRNTGEMIHEFDSPVTQIFSNGKLIYGIDFETGAVYSHDPVAGTSATIVKNNDLGGQIKYATLVTSRNTLVAYTSGNEIYEISMATGKAEKQTVTGTLEEAEALDFFGTNIYLLSKDDNQIYKRFSTSSGYGRRNNYFTEAPDLSGVVDIAINGALFTTTATAEINKYTSGARDNFSLSGMPSPYTDIRGAFASVATDGLYLYTGSLVIKIDENGKFVAQYAQDDAKSISSVFVNDDTSSIYFLSDKKLFEINI